MALRKKIKSYQDLYPTPQKQYGIATRHSESFRLNVPYITFLASVPPLLITAVTSLDVRESVNSKTDIANHSILFIIVYILAGLFSIVALMGLRSALRTRVANFGFLALVYLLAFLPACLIVANAALASSVTVAILPPFGVAVVSVVIFMFVFSIVASATNR